jgi:hypothetical protein
MATPLPRSIPDANRSVIYEFGCLPRITFVVLTLSNVGAERTRRRQFKSIPRVSKSIDLLGQSSFEAWCALSGCCCMTRRQIMPNPSGSLTVFVRTHLLRDFAPIQATLGQPGAGALGSALDQRVREGEIGWRSHQWTERRRNEILDSRVESMQFMQQLARDQQRQRMQRAGNGVAWGSL